MKNFLQLFVISILYSCLPPWETGKTTTYNDHLKILTVPDTLFLLKKYDLPIETDMTHTETVLIWNDSATMKAFYINETHESSDTILSFYFNSSYCTAEYDSLYFEWSDPNAQIATSYKSSFPIIGINPFTIERTSTGFKLSCSEEDLIAYYSKEHQTIWSILSSNQEVVFCDTLPFGKEFHTPSEFEMKGELRAHIMIDDIIAGVFESYTL